MLKIKREKSQNNFAKWLFMDRMQFVPLFYDEYSMRSIDLK